MKQKVKNIPWEAIIWIVTLIGLAFISPHQEHFSICPIKNLGYSFCPGCGLGTSVSLAFHGHFKESLATHPLGIFAILVLSFRIIKLFKTQYLTTNNTNNYGERNGNTA